MLMTFRVLPESVLYCLHNGRRPDEGVRKYHANSFAELLTNFED